METSSYAEISWNGAADGKKTAATDKKTVAVCTLWPSLSDNSGSFQQLVAAFSQWGAFIIKKLSFCLDLGLPELSSGSST